MKINAFNQAFRFLGLNKDGEGAGNLPYGPGSERRQGSQQQQDQGAPEQQQQSIEVTEEKIQKALEAFASDARLLSSGLRAAIRGSGASLQIILSDASGAVLRQLSPEEFLRLRQNAGSDKAKRGSLLDRKL